MDDKQIIMGSIQRVVFRNKLSIALVLGLPRSYNAEWREELNIFQNVFEGYIEQLVQVEDYKANAIKDYCPMRVFPTDLPAIREQCYSSGCTSDLYNNQKSLDKVKERFNEELSSENIKSVLSFSNSSIHEQPETKRLLNDKAAEGTAEDDL
ncbi:hypothetical protein FDP41_007129 [Naegleria fowleri]|uniref:Uncharacterized protein n=1 Tax=Naegleria fowleri TaxID=5763 RepID=A0A6A5BG34_NAEFO|nr:uncharacterized protein FDP41_007129 [Naegleria fowleri]KAF0973742.1 hypothetical protein FDP41_007129 [Naegleria fowleri]